MMMFWEMVKDFLKCDRYKVKYEMQKEIILDLQCELEKMNELLEILNDSLW